MSFAGGRPAEDQRLPRKRDQNEDINKHDRNDYFNASRQLFRHDCDYVTDHCGQSGDLAREEEVQDIQFGERAVFIDVLCPEGACHSMHIKPFAVAKIHKGQQANIMVIRGGLTSAQITDLAAHKSVSKVYHLVRGAMNVKPFDVDLEWIGNFAN
ncbi:hypothetical protein K402DRAFT_422926 [Aulographum hederae CBS 113979]|uniref:Uncharacterized protein n=1 Tax=Aulographum hederae CBS 113979 TaxID=1176131 RepID=A0A6G1GUJ2_9PEZI|nr:hypothetical protein K402DRAFT_422926 [Aulographum hederae CBS 113979]